MTTPPPPDVPDGWPRPDPSELEHARRVVAEALSDDTARPATDRLGRHYDPTRRGAGTTFLELPPVDATELLDVLQLCLDVADLGSREEQVARARDGRAALGELRQLLAARQWPRIVRGGLPPGPHFLQLDDRELTALLAGTQDANAELRDRLELTEAQLRDCRTRLEATRSARVDRLAGDVAEARAWARLLVDTFGIPALTGLGPPPGWLTAPWTGGESDP